MPKVFGNRTGIDIKAEPVRIQRSMQDLIEIIAHYSQYHKYEVEDILLRLAGAMHLMLARGESVKINGLGTFSRRRVKPRTFISPLTNAEYLIHTSDSVSFKPDTTLRRVMQEARDNQGVKKNEVLRENVKPKKKRKKPTASTTN